MPMDFPDFHKLIDLIKRTHEQVIASGFYECPSCRGSGSIEIKDTDGSFIEYDGAANCYRCGGTGTDLDKDFSGMLMRIIIELGKALEDYSHEQPS